MSKLFLLGGYDLEMETIKLFLLDHGYRDITKNPNQNNFEKCFADKKLRWGANVKEYSEYLKYKGDIYGIELKEDNDFIIPNNYIRIDHHNDLVNKPSALEQVIKIVAGIDYKQYEHQLLKLIPNNSEIRGIANQVKVDLVRYIKLVVANDKGYIAGMKAINATDDEIRVIRKQDREAQGVTEKDELQAEKSIKDNSRFICGVRVVKSLTNRFSPITDRLYPYSNLVVHTDTEINFFGKNAINLRGKFKNYEGAYFGGELENTYWGLPKTKATDELLQTIIREAMEFSHHIFLFPFKVDKREQINTIKLISRNNWRPCEPDESLNYNEKTYFHKRVLNALALGEEKDIYFEEVTDNDSYLLINIKYNDNQTNNETSLLDRNIRKKKKPEYFEEKEYKLKITKVSLLKHTNYGVGLLALHLSNVQYDKPQDILLINQYGRRLYPPFKDKHFECFNENVENEIDGTKHRVLPKSIEIIDSSNSCAKEDWSDFNNNSKYIPKHIKHLLSNGDAKISPILDDRMFVMCWYGAEQLTESFQKKRVQNENERKEYGMVLSDICKRVKSAYEVGASYRNAENHKVIGITPGYNGYGYVSNDFWYKFLFVDGTSKMCQNEIMQQQLVDSQTYARWVEYCTLFGVSRYSFVQLTQPLKDLLGAEINAAFLVDHFKTIYFRMVSLTLMQRSMIIEFDNRSASISKNLNSAVSQKEKSAVEEVERLIKDYTEFLNCIFHREITPQEQGIELYDLLQKNLRVDYQAKELEREIDELHRNADLIANRRTADYINKITVIGGVLLFPTFIASMAQVGFFDVIRGGEFPDFSYILLDNWIPISPDSFINYVFPHGKLTGTILYVGVVVWWLFKYYISPPSNRIRVIRLFLSALVLTAWFTAMYATLDVVMGFAVFLSLTILLVFLPFLSRVAMGVFTLAKILYNLIYDSLLSVIEIITSAFKSLVNRAKHVIKRIIEIGSLVRSKLVSIPSKLKLSFQKITIPVWLKNPLKREKPKQKSKSK